MKACQENTRWVKPNQWVCYMVQHQQLYKYYLINDIDQTENVF